jgi:hypothetical protein
MMEMSLYSFERGQPLDTSMLFDVQHEYLPLPLRAQLYKTFYSGFINVFRVAAHLFKTGIPTAQALNDELFRMQMGMRTVPMEYFDFRATQAYTKKGGRVEYVLDAITDCARQQSAEAGDGTFNELVEEDVEGLDPGEWALSWRRLPVCANDGEFDLVRRMLGLDPKVGWGPYEHPSLGKSTSRGFMFGDSDEDEGDSEDEEDEEDRYEEMDDEDADEDEDEMSE